MTAALATIEDDVTGFRAPPVRAEPTRRIRDDAEAIAVAEEVSAKLAEGAATRDRDRILPYEEMDLLSDSRPTPFNRGVRAGKCFDRRKSAEPAGAISPCPTPKTVGVSLLYVALSASILARRSAFSFSASASAASIPPFPCSAT
jgi:hypothetical protein